MDHNVPTTSRARYKTTTQFIEEAESRIQCETFEQNVADFNIMYFGLGDKRQGIVHVIGPEQGFTLPGTTLVCGDSHTSTHGAFGSLAHGIGTSEVEHVLATQTLIQKRSKNMKIEVNGNLLPGVSSKDIILHIIGKIGTAGATGHVIEFCGSTIRDLSMEARMTVCNMSIEAGAKAGVIAPDEKTLRYIDGRPLAISSERDPKGWEKATQHWASLHSDAGACWNKEIAIQAEDVSPTVSWGTSPEDVVAISGAVPRPSDFTGAKRESCEHALRYMDLVPGTKMTEIKIDKVFIGSCTNSRIEDIRLVAKLVNGKRIPQHVHAIVVPGSGLVKRQAEQEGLDRMLVDAGFEWRESGCSMCVGMNADVLLPGQRCASTTNRNFEGRQGVGGRTHLVSPALAAAAALKGRLADVREVEGYERVIARSKTSANPVEISIDDHSVQGTSICEQHIEIKGMSAPRSTVGSTGMDKFTVLKGTAAPLRRSNIDTDVILPKQFCKTIKRAGLSKGLFFDWRFDEQGNERPDFILNRTPYNTAKILVTGSNFGCGSSREHAPWALLDFGIRCIIASSFGEIFYNNSLKNGILPLIVEQSVVDLLMEEAEAGGELEVDLTQNVINNSSDEKLTDFDVDRYQRYRLLNGIDDISITLQLEAKIVDFERQTSLRTPWLAGPCHSRRSKSLEELSPIPKVISVDTASCEW
jgi:3-isopropylmalate dehydratase